MNLRGLKIDPEKLASLQSLMESNPKLRSLLTETAESPTDRALRYLALVRLFDHELYQRVCQANDPEVPGFEEIIDHPDVEAVPRSDEKYWLRNAAVDPLLAEWRDRRDEERIWSKRFYNALKDMQAPPLDLLDQLLRFDTGGALSLLQREYERADKNNNLAECHSYVERIEAEIDRIPEGERGLFLQFVTRYRARALFLTELQVTTNYFPRPDLEKVFDDFVRGDGKEWILFLDAPGGMGKTTFIQRMIAHKLLNQPPFPLVVRTDLDRLDVAALASAPWLIALELAADLEVQLADKLFSAGTPSFLEEVETFRPLLYQRASSRGPEISDRLRKDLAKQARAEFDRWSKFFTLCFALPHDRPLVLFIDTVEEASLHVPDEFRKVLERLEDLHQSVPQLRLILSGRYRPDGSHFASYDQQLRNQTIFATLDCLKNDESKAFIRQFVKPAPDERLQNVIVESSGGNPFKLSLLCEYVTDQPGISAENLADFGKDADVAYLLKRVIDRIPVDTELGLRWLLRYGAIPRRLTYSFVEENLQPLLIRALQGELESEKEDIPSEKEKKSWLQRAGVELSPKFLWERLIKYSSEHGWISVDRNDPNTVALHPEVTKPMRRLLKKQVATGGNIYTILNAEAGEHFKRLKAKYPERWVDYTLGELFHRFERGEGDPLKVLKDAFSEKAGHGDAFLRLGLAREIIKPDGDFAESPTAVRAWAYFEAADALAISGNYRYLPVDSRRQELSRLLERASELANNGDVELPAIVWRWREFLGSNYPEFRAAIFTLLGFKADDRSRYWLLLIDLFGQEKLKREPFFFLRVLMTVFPQWVESSRIPSWAWKERYAASLIELGGYNEAVRTLKGLLASDRSWLEPNDQGRIRARIIKALILSLRLNEAEEQLKDFAVDEEREDDKKVMMAEIHLLRRDAWSALECVQNLRESSSYRAEGIRGIAYGQLLRVPEAVAAFKDALEAARSTGEQSRGERILLEELRFRLFEANLPTEIAPVRSVERLGSAALTQAELELCRAWQHREQQNPTAAQSIVQALSAKNYASLIRARAMLAAFSWGLLPEASINLLLDLMRGISNYSARIALTALPVQFDKDLRPGSVTAFYLDNVLSPIDDGGCKLVWLYGAKLLRAVGKSGKAESFFRKGKVGQHPTRSDLAMLRQFRLADGVSEPPETWEAFRDEPGLYMAVTIECAERAWKAGDFDRAREALALSPQTPELDRRLPAFADRRKVLEKSLGTAPVASAEVLNATLISQAGTDASETSEPSQSLVLGTEGERLVAYLRGQPSYVFISTVENDALAILTSYSGQRTPRRFVELLMKDWEQALSDLRAPFYETGLMLRPEDGKWITLSLMTPQLVAVPWELALQDRPGTLVRLSVGIKDTFGPDIAERRPVAMRGFGDSPSVTFFSPSPSAQEFEIATRLDAKLLPTIEKADIVYVVSSIYADTRGEPSLGSGRLSAEALCFQIAAVFGTLTPFVVLYVPAQGLLSNILEDLLIRNRFAHGLVCSGAVSGVLATSVDDPRRVMNALTQARTLAEIPRLMRMERSNQSNQTTTIINAGSALFLRAQ